MQTSITVSIGVAAYPRDSEAKEGLVTAADGAMYQAKQAGRNRVCLHGASDGGEADTANNDFIRLG